MTQARRVAPGSTYLITRRTVRRTLLFRPDALVTDFYLYCLAVYSSKYRIAVHAVVLMSNHEHLVVTDMDGRLPDFLRDFHRVVALGLQVIRKWQGEVWDGAATSCVELCTPKAIIEKLAYAMCNPVRAGLVATPDEWPGLMVLPEELGNKSWRVRRPSVFFDGGNPMWPDLVELRFSMPAHYLCDEELRKAVASELVQLQHLAREKLRTSGMKPLGRNSVQAASPRACARSVQDKTKKVQPAVAVGHAQGAILKEALASLRLFRKKYHIALQRWREGIRDAIFPQHTWVMSWLHGVTVESKPA